MLGVNALSGISTRSIEPPKFGAEQDYVVVGEQPWLDGIVSGPGVVRQVSKFLNIKGIVWTILKVCCGWSRLRIYRWRTSYWESRIWRLSVWYFSASSRGWWEVPLGRKTGRQHFISFRARNSGRPTCVGTVITLCRGFFTFIQSHKLDKAPKNQQNCFGPG